VKRYNILLIITEQQRGDCLGCDGHPVLLTPNMDNIARNGVRFVKSYANCPVCQPARRTILSGQYPSTHGLLSNNDGVQWQPKATLPQVLRNNGYQTRWIGRDHHQYPKRARFGYDEMENGGYTPGSNYYDWLKEHAPADSGGWYGGGVMHNDWTARPWPLAEYLHETNWTVQRALTFLGRRDPTCPFFLTLSFIASHPPLQPPAFYFDRYLRTGVPEPYIGDWAKLPGQEKEDLVAPNRIDLKGEALLSARAAYYGLINHIDDQLRRVINNVTGLSHRQDTIICFVSDHGEMLGDHYLWRKQVGYEGSARIPFLLSAPAELNVTPGTVINTPVTQADIMPTLLDMVGIDIPDTVDGQSLLPLMTGRSEIKREYVHIEHSGYPHALTDGHEKYMWNPADGGEQLFDMDRDPHELHDITLEDGGDERMEIWRRRLIEVLKGRPEGFTDGEKLIAGRPRMSCLEHAGPRETFERKCFVT